MLYSCTVRHDWTTQADISSPLLIEHADAITFDTRKYTYKSERANPQTIYRW